jgi:hypothetical protein
LITGIAAHTLASNRSCTPATEQLEHVVAGRIEPAHHLRDDRDRVVLEDGRKVVGEHPARGWVFTLLSGVADERLDDAETVTGRPLDVGRGVGQQAVDRRADRPVAEQGDGNVNGRHEPPRLPRGR